MPGTYHALLTTNKGTFACTGHLSFNVQRSGAIDNITMQGAKAPNCSNGTTSFSATTLNAGQFTTSHGQGAAFQKLTGSITPNGTFKMTLIGSSIAYGWMTGAAIPVGA